MFLFDAQGKRSTSCVLVNNRITQSKTKCSANGISNKMHGEIRTSQSFMRYKADWLKQMERHTSLAHYLKKKKSKLSTVGENVTKCQNQNSYRIKQNIFLEIKTAAQTYRNFINQIHEKGRPQQARMSTLINTVKQNYHIRQVMKKGREVELLFSVVRFCSNMFVWVPENDGGLEQYWKEKEVLGK